MPTPVRSAVRVVLLRWWKLAAIVCAIGFPLNFATQDPPNWIMAALSPLIFPVLTLPFLAILLLLLPRSGGGDAERVARAERVSEKDAVKRPWPTASGARGAADEPLE